MKSSHRPEFIVNEDKILKFWEERKIFDRLFEKNRGGPKYSFLDGPITANNPMGVHHAWGRTLKDVLQRYWGLRGYEQRYQNGYDCQGLWVEVEVEKALKLKSKSDIVEMGLDKFARLCRERVKKYSGVQTQQSILLGQWMDWQNNYFTLTNTNILYIWHFLKTCNSRGWISRGERPMPWCPRCGTSLSQHELGEGYKDVTHDAVFLKFPLLDKPDESLLVWTTTPWTLTANTAAAVHPEATYAKVKDADSYLYLAEPLLHVLKPGYEVVDQVKGADLVGRKYRGAFAEFEANKDIDYHVIPWDEVSMGEGTGIVHIAPGCGPEDYELGKEQGLGVVSPIDEAGDYYQGFGFLVGKNASAVAQEVFDSLKEKDILYKIESHEHSYPHCWRDGTELLFRTVTEWFIDPDADYGDGKTVRQHMLDANDKVEWSPKHVKLRMVDWLTNMQSWCISRKRFWGLPLPFYTNEEGDRYHVVGSIEELRELAIDDDKARVDELPEIHRPWIDDIRIKDPETGEVLTRVPEVGDCWLDAGVVPFSTYGYKDLVPYDEYKPEQDEMNGGDSRHLATVPSWSHEYWNDWFPAESICEMRAQTRAWFYSLLFMSVALEDRSPYLKVYTYEDVRDEKGDEMHKSAGNAIWFDDAVKKSGAEPMRWLYCGHNPSSSLLFGFKALDDATRKLLDIWNIYKFFNTYASLDKPVLRPVEQLQDGMTLLDHWVLSRLQTLVEQSRAYYESFEIHHLVKSVEEFCDDLSNWYIRRNRRRFWKSALNENKQAAYQTLGHVIVVMSQVMSPMAPFISEQVFRGMVGGQEGWPESVHLLDYPESNGSLKNQELETAIPLVRQIVSLALSARATANMRTRQPLAEMLVCASNSHKSAVDTFETDILEEINVKKITFVDSVDEYETVNVKPNFASLKQHIDKDNMQATIQRIKQANAEELIAQLRSGDDTLSEDDLLIEHSSKDGFSVQTEEDVSVVLDVRLDEELTAEGHARDFVRKLQVQRRELGLKVEQRIELHVHADTAVRTAIEKHKDYMAEELLVTDFVFDKTRADNLKYADIPFGAVPSGVAILPAGK